MVSGWYLLKRIENLNHFVKVILSTQSCITISQRTYHIQLLHMNCMLLEKYTNRTEESELHHQLDFALYSCTQLLENLMVLSCIS